MGSEFKADLINKRLHVRNMYMGDIIVEDMDERKCHEWLLNFAKFAREMAQKALVESDKFAPKD